MLSNKFEIFKIHSHLTNGGSIFSLYINFCCLHVLNNIQYMIIQKLCIYSFTSLNLSTFYDVGKGFVLLLVDLSSLDSSACSESYICT